MKTILKLMLMQLIMNIPFLITAQTYDTITLGQTVTGHISHPLDDHYYTVITNQDGALVWNLSVSDPNSYRGLNITRAQNGSWVTGVDKVQISTNNQLIGSTCSPETYNLWIGADMYSANDDFSFVVTLSSPTEPNDQEPNNHDNEALALSPNTSVTGHLNFASSCLSSTCLDAADLYAFTTNTNGNVRFFLNMTPNEYQTSDNKTYMSLRKGQFDLRGESNGLQKDTLVVNNLEAGTYILTVQSNANVGGPVFGNGYTLKNIFYGSSLPSATISDKSTPEGNTGTKQLKLPVTLSSAYSDTVKIKFKTKNNTAKAASDYIAGNGVLIFNPGETSKKISVTINGDTRIEPDETFYVVLYRPENATIADDTATGTIRNDEGTALIDEFTSSEKIKSTSLITGIKVYPNPVKDMLYIETNDVAIFYLSDARGKLILTKQVQNNGSIDVSKLPAGLYFLKNSLTGVVQKIVIEK